MDLALEISKKAKRVILSHHLKDPIGTVFPDSVVQVNYACKCNIKNKCLKNIKLFQFFRNQM